MNSRWKTYLQYANLIIIGGGLIFIVVETIRAKNTGFEVKTLWDWMELLVIPVVLAVGVFYLNRSERAVERQIAEERANLEREIATDRQQETALQAYIDRMSELLLKEKLLTTEVEEVRDVARTRTLTLFRVLDPTRKGLVLRFLHEADLICKGNPIILLKGTDLRWANLSGANLRSVNLSGANLYSTNLFDANLSDSDLSNVILNEAILFNTDLRNTDLSNAYLNDTDLRTSDFRGTNLRGASLKDADLRSSDLSDSNFDGAKLTGADLSGAILDKSNLSNADLTNVKLTSKQLVTTKSLKGAIMPDGTIHE